MISDFRILGIEETDDVLLIKSAFRKRVKELHPDLSTSEDALARHDLFDAVCRAYRRLMESRKESGAPRPKAESAKPGGTDVSVYADQAYAFYKQGMKHFMRIHPSRWVVDEAASYGAKTPDGQKAQEEIRRKVMELVKLFPKAYYYFSIVANEYPDSIWAFDSRAKMDKIEERIGRYRKIIESFSNWNVDEHVTISEYHAKYVLHEENRKIMRKGRGTDW